MIRLSRAVACVLAVSLAAPALACMPPEATEFRKYPVQMYAGGRKPVDFSSHPVAASLNDADKERVRNAVDAGANFAGAYRIVYAPCGEKCNAILVINLDGQDPPRAGRGQHVRRLPRQQPLYRRTLGRAAGALLRARKRLVRAGRGLDGLVIPRSGGLSLPETRSCS
jgi:hypothetical protein